MRSIRLRLEMLLTTDEALARHIELILIVYVGGSLLTQFLQMQFLGTYKRMEFPNFHGQL